MDDAPPIAAPRPLAFRERVAGAALQVTLINLPWASYRRPSIQLGLLGALAERAGHRVEQRHLNLDLAARLGPPLYDLIADHRSTALGEWLFARAAFGARAPPPDGFLSRYGGVAESLLARAATPLGLDDLLQFREEGAEQFLRDQIAAVDWPAADVFGLTSTFQQNNACFAMARILKASFPGSVVVAGGANFDGDMGAEWLAAAEGLDMVVSGEGDVAFPSLLAALAAGGSLDEAPNLIRRMADGSLRRNPAASPFHDMDSLPTPDYRAYFARAEALELLSPGARREVDLPVETSRGCWWGERRHCTFCGLNGETMAYRSKSAERVMDELTALSRDHRSYRFAAVDNILNMRFHKTLFPAIAERGLTYNLFYEVKSGLSPERLKELRAAGVVRVQPGIESLSTHVLSLMNKGVKAIANVNFLRWCSQLGIDASWNLIWGFPGELEADYLAQAELLPNLFHLQPPVGAGRIWLERFSPLFQDRAADARPIVPEASLSHVYPASVDLQRAAYFFEYDLETEVPGEAYDGFMAAAAAWKQAHARETRPRLEYRYSPDFLQVDDTRWSDEAGIYTFEGEVAQLYVAMAERPRPLAELRRATSLDAAAFTAALDQLCRDGLAMREGELALALAVPHRAEGRR